MNRRERWLSVPLPFIRVIGQASRSARRAGGILVGQARRIGARALGRGRVLDPASMQRLFEQLLHMRAESYTPVARTIVHVCGNLQHGGAERQLVYTLQGLACLNYESVQLLCHNIEPGRDQYDFYAPMLVAAGIHFRQIRRAAASAGFAGMPPPLRKLVRRLPAGLAEDVADLYQEFTRLRPGVVHAWLDWDNVRAGLAAVLAGVPKVILSGRSVNPSHFEFYKPYMASAYRALAQIPVVSIINNSRAGADDYADWIGIPRGRIRVIHNAVDFGARSRLSPQDAREARAALGIPADAFVVGGVFRLEAEKRPLLWIETATRVAEELPDSWFLIYGRGRMQRQLIRAAEEGGFGNRLVLPGLTQDIVSAMSIMDVLLLTSLVEGLPNVLLEAQWSGTPAVTTDAGGASEAISPNVTGWAVSSGTARELADRILWLHGNPQVRSAVRDQGPAFVRENFGIDRMVAETAKLYGSAPN
jgi:glycosyltransferase involved in cell wall biosynthesis